jgi:glycyl-tRNA synthetase beta subunit
LFPKSLKLKRQLLGKFVVRRNTSPLTLKATRRRAAEGFARSQGVSVQDLIVKATEKGEFVFAVKREEGQPALEVLSEALPQIIRSLSFPKTMRWEESGLPLRASNPLDCRTFGRGCHPL